MQFSGLSHFVRSTGWMKNIADLHKNNNLREVERAGFLAVNVEQEPGPFVHTVAVFGWTGPGR
jgi:hypothetical protein